MAGQKDYNAVIAAAVKQGFRVVKKGSKLMLMAPDGVNKVTCAATPSDHRAVKNLIARLRKFGFVWKGR